MTNGNIKSKSRVRCSIYNLQMFLKQFGRQHDMLSWMASFPCYVHINLTKVPKYKIPSEIDLNAWCAHIVASLNIIFNKWDKMNCRA